MTGDVHSNVHAYVVGALDPAETREFEAHLATCEACRRDTMELREVTAQLSAAAAVDPPASLRSSILAQIAVTPQSEAPEDEAPARSPGPAEGSASASSQDQAAPPRPAEASHVRGRHVAPVPAAEGAPAESRPAEGAPAELRPRASRATRVSALLAAAAVLAAIALGGWAIQNRQDARDATAQNERLAQLLSAGDVRTASSGFSTSGSGAVVMSQTRQLAMFVGSDLPHPPDGKAYEAWTINGGKPKPAGMFSPKGSRSWLRLPTDVFSAKTLAVTVEPEAGSPQPTSDPVFAVDVPQ